MSRVERDYYDVLGVPRNADAREVKQAFRALARRHHPDVSPDPAAQERFREAAEAYRVLSKPLARLLYDRYGYVMHADGVLAAPSEDSTAKATASTELAVEAIEAERGTTRTVRVTGGEACERCGGAGVPPGVPVELCSACEGGGRITRSTYQGSGRLVQVDPCPSCGGAGRVVPEPCGLCRGTGRTAVERTVTVPIPAGVRGGERLRVDGVDVRVRVLPERDFRLVRYASVAALALAVGLFVLLLVSPL